jgi:transketolase
MHKLSYIPLSEIQRIRHDISDGIIRCRVLSDIFRINTLYMITNAGSGHIGSSFSFMDIITYLWEIEMVNPNSLDNVDGDLCFSSKGHDAPGMYSMLLGMEKLDFDLIHQLRKIDGLPGHPDVSTPYVVTNTGSLGMGISKAKGMVLANRLNNKKRRIFVITGDGELQEGQFWESLQPVANLKLSEIHVVIDHNKIQSDTWVKDVSDLGGLETKLKAFNWEVACCDGHDYKEITKIFKHFSKVGDRPKILIAETVKGKGVSFMETIHEKYDGFYQFHSGAPSIEDYMDALDEMLERVNAELQSLDIEKIILKKIELQKKQAPNNPDKLIVAYSEELVKLAGDNLDIVALDADLILDTGLIPFRENYPERFIECGIAEQDMVSTAGGMALQGKLPIVHSFACFLTTRPNEHIYNNATEKTKIIYVGSLAGVLPSGPGYSHQSVRDIPLMGSVPGMTLIQPSCEQEVKEAIRWAVKDNDESTYIRLVSIPCEIPFVLPADYILVKGQGNIVVEGKDGVIFAYGPVLLSEAYKATKILLERYQISFKVINLPWLNNLDSEWIKLQVKEYSKVFTLDDHYTDLGQGFLISSILSQIQIEKHIVVVNIGLEEIPVCGQNNEALNYHQLDAESIANRVMQAKIQ